MTIEVKISTRADLRILGDPGQLRERLHMLDAWLAQLPDDGSLISNTSYDVHSALISIEASWHEQR